MAAVMHVTEFLKAPDKKLTGNIVAMSGNEHHLKSAAIRKIAELVLGEDDDGFGLTRLSGKEVDLATVIDEVATVSMWGDKRLVVVDDAEDFVKKYREGLGKALATPPKKSVLVLDVTTWPKTTRLAKHFAEVGTELQCSVLKGVALERWLVVSTRDDYGKKLEQPAAALLAELSGSELGLLTQEIGKLASYVGEKPSIGVEDVRKLVGGWKAETTWTMINSVRDGDVGHGLECLDKLLISGEASLRLLAGINFVFRKLARTTELASQGIGLQSALRQAGVFPNDVEDCGKYLRRMGRPKAERIADHMLNTESGLKGASRLPDRIQIERLLLSLSGRVS